MNDALVAEMAPIKFLFVSLRFHGYTEIRILAGV